MNELNQRIDFLKNRYRIDELPFIEYPYRSTYIMGETSIHNELRGLQGGISNQYYHLTKNQYDAIVNATTPTESNPFLTTLDIGAGLSLDVDGKIQLGKLTNGYFIDVQRINLDEFPYGALFIGRSDQPDLGNHIRFIKSADEQLFLAVHEQVVESIARGTQIANQLNPITGDTYATISIRYGSNFSAITMQKVGTDPAEMVVLDQISSKGLGDSADYSANKTDFSYATKKMLTDAVSTKLESSDIANFETNTQLNARDTANRSRANHTGTQLVSTISDFDSAVAANSAVATNTAKVTNATHTGDVTGATALTIANDVVTNAKLANVATATIKGRVTAATGDPEDLTATQVRTLINVADGANNYTHPNHSGDITSTGDGATLIANDAVTNAKLANMTALTFKGRVTASTGDPEDLTATQATSLLNLFSSSLKGLAPASGGGTANFLRADGAWTSSVSFVAIPASKTATGTVGQFAVDSNFLYICVATNTWQRIAIDTSTW